MSEMNDQIGFVNDVFCELFESMDEMRVKELGTDAWKAWRIGREICSERSEGLDLRDWSRIRA